MRTVRVPVLLFAAALGACDKPPEPATAPVIEAEKAQAVVVETVQPVIQAVREAVAEIAPVPPPPTCFVHPDAVALIVRFEIISAAYYTKRLQAPVVPPLQSGVTIGVGDDLRFSTTTRIERDWVDHLQMLRLLPAAGLVGDAARAFVPTMADVRTPFTLAYTVFEKTVLPRYCELAARTFRNGWDSLSQHAQGGIIATVYVRGASMLGASRREMATIRDDCAPRGDVECIAKQHELMPRVWVGTAAANGLRNRMLATAALIRMPD